MRKNSPLILLFVVIILLGAWFFFWKQTTKDLTQNSGVQQIACTMEAKICPDGTAVGRHGPNCEFDACPEVVDTHVDLIKVATPAQNSVVSSPLKVTGEARGTWYFEASFPVKVLDANGKVLVSLPAQAKSDWMTTSFVPFEVTLTFSKPTTPTGTIVLSKDNPSGDPSKDDSISIPVTFSQ